MLKSLAQTHVIQHAASLKPLEAAPSLKPLETAGLEFAGAQDSISLMKIEQERRVRPRTRVQPWMLSNEYGMLACVAHVCDRN